MTPTPRRSTRLPRVPKALEPKRAERDYQVMVLRLVFRLHAEAERALLPAYSRAFVEVQRTLPAEIRSDAIGRLDDAIADLFKDVGGLRIVWGQLFDLGGDVARRLEAIGRDVDEVGKDGLGAQFEAVLGIDPLIGEPFLADQLDIWRRSNVALIKSIGTRYHDEIEGIVARALQDGTRPEELAKGIAVRYGVSRSRAMVIARDQVSKLRGQLDMLRQQEVGIARYVWRTVHAERVRKSHAEKDGKTFKWSDPPADTGHPGQDYQCRCYAEPVLDDVLGTIK